MKKLNMNADDISKSVADTVRKAKRLLFKYAPDTEFVLGFTELCYVDDVKTIATVVKDSHIYLKCNPDYVAGLTPYELAVLFYIETVRIALGHVTSRLYSNKKLSLIASDMIAIRMGMRTDIGVDNTIYGRLHEHVAKMEASISTLYRRKYYKEYDYRNVSIEIIYRLLEEWEHGRHDNDSDDSDESNKSSDNSNISSYLNDETRANDWTQNNCLTTEIATMVTDHGKQWGNEDANGTLVQLISANDKIDVRKLIRTLVSRSIEYGKLESRYKRNRRFGLLYPGYVSDYRAKILIACDVSTSMRNGNLESTVNILTETAKQIDIDYCCWSTSCTFPTKLSKKNARSKKLTLGIGGGTDCTCLFNMLNKAKCRYDLIIIISDMEFNHNIPASPRANPRKILWVKTANLDPPSNLAKHVINLSDITV